MKMFRLSSNSLKQYVRMSSSLLLRNSPSLPLRLGARHLHHTESRLVEEEEKKKKTFTSFKNYYPKKKDENAGGGAEAKTEAGKEDGSSSSSTSQSSGANRASGGGNTGGSGKSPKPSDNENLLYLAVGGLVTYQLIRFLTSNASGESGTASGRDSEIIDWQKFKRFVALPFHSSK